MKKRANCSLLTNEIFFFSSIVYTLRGRRLYVLRIQQLELELEERFLILKAPCKLPSVHLAAYNLKPLLLFLLLFFFTFRVNNTRGGVAL